MINNKYINMHVFIIAIINTHTHTHTPTKALGTTDLLDGKLLLLLRTFQIPAKILLFHKPREALFVEEKKKGRMGGRGRERKNRKKEVLKMALLKSLPKWVKD